MTDISLEMKNHLIFIKKITQYLMLSAFCTTGLFLLINIFDFRQYNSFSIYTGIAAVAVFCFTYKWWSKMNENYQFYSKSYKMLSNYFCKDEKTQNFDQYDLTNKSYLFIVYTYLRLQGILLSCFCLIASLALFSCAGNLPLEIVFALFVLVSFCSLSFFYSEFLLQKNGLNSDYRLKKETLEKMYEDLF